MRRLDDKIVLVTGAAAGVGRIVAEAITGAGGVAVTGDVDGKHGVDHVLDVTREAAWRAVIDRIAAEHGRLDGLVNAVALGVGGNVEETTLTDWRRAIDVDVLGPFLGVRAAWSMLGDAGGSVVSVSAAPGPTGAPDDAAAGALRQLTRAAALDGARQPQRIRVNAVFGALADRPEDVAAWVLYLLSDESAFVTGASYVLDGLAAGG